MKLNLERTFTAPFSTYGESEISKIYLIAGGITLAAIAVSFVFNMIINVIMSVMTPLFSNNPSSMMVIFLVGIPLILLTLLIQVAANSIPMGYVTETAKLEVYDRESIMPTWTGNYKRFFLNGLKIQLIFFVYTLVIIVIPIIIFLPIFMIAQGGLPSGNDLTSSVLGLAFVIFIFFVVFLYMLLLPFIWINFAATGKILSAFNILTPIKVIFSNILDYIIAVAVTIALFIAYVVVITILTCTCVGILLVPLVAMFIMPIIVLNMFAQIYKTTYSA